MMMKLMRFLNNGDNDVADDGYVQNGGDKNEEEEEIDNDDKDNGNKNKNYNWKW